ncbi:uncharacterized protein G2W53_041014 [Senna tora]|uniref:Uncharacterized protein n=1 Tax=Senna tora TaxID=362788 RepID=A0A834VXN1_9FABA|nr:uncharacterized protein G2W53_041014 [Senna tora]
MAKGCIHSMPRSQPWGAYSGVVVTTKLGWS